MAYGQRHRWRRHSCCRGRTGPTVGTRVVGHPESAGWAERVAVPTAKLTELPADVPLATAAALPLARLTALRLARAAGSLAGARVLITGASGGYTDSTFTDAADLATLTRLVARGNLHPEIELTTDWATPVRPSPGCSTDSCAATPSHHPVI